MGVSLDDNLNKDSENKESIYTIGYAMFQNIFRPYLKWVFNIPFIKYGNSYQEALRTAHNFTNSVINFILARNVFIGRGTPKG